MKEIDEVMKDFRLILYDLNTLCSDYVRADDLADWERTTVQFIEEKLTMFKKKLEEK